MPNRTPSRSERIFAHALHYITPCQSHEGVPCAIVPNTPFAQDIFPIRSVLFRDWLTDTFHREREVFPTLSPLRHAIKLLEGKARRSEFPRQTIALRTASLGDPLNPTAILLDLANPTGDAVEITPEGWQIKTIPHSFRRTTTQHPLPTPVPNPEPPAPTTMPPAAAAWLLSALRPTGPYPILVLKGPAGSGKTFLAHKLRTLIDPATSTFCPLPRTEHDLMRHAWNNYILAFDHANRLRPQVVSALCRLSSGASFDFERFNPNDSTAVRLQRPIILTVPDDEPAPVDVLRYVANHAITIDLPAIRPAQRQTEHQLLTEFDEARPALLGSLCTAVSLALGNVDTTTLECPSRFADASQWACAAAPALGISQHTMRATLTPDALARQIAAFAYEKQYWEGSATELLETLKAAQVSNLPASPVHLTRRLNRAPLSTLGISFDVWKSNGNRKLRVAVTARSTATLTQCA